MEHIEAHLITSAHDITLANEAGLPSTPVGVCTSCSKVVGLTDSRFIAYAIVMNDGKYWNTCKGCYRPVLNP